MVIIITYPITNINKKLCMQGAFHNMSLILKILQSISILMKMFSDSLTFDFILDIQYPAIVHLTTNFFARNI